MGRNCHSLKLPRSESYFSTLLYLEAALSDYKEDGNTEALWTALYDVVAAQGGIGKLAERAKVNPEHLNDILASKQEPRLDNLQNILSGLGFQIRLEFAENQP